MSRPRKQDQQLPNVGIEWINDCEDDEEKDDRVRSLIRARSVLEKLVDILEKRKEKYISTRVNDYKSPDWSHYQAHRNGQIEEIDFISTLLDPIVKD